MLSNRAAAVVLLPSSCVAAVVVLLFAVAQAAAPVAGNQRPRWVYESMTVQPVFSPDNSVKEIVTLINSATTTLDVQNQYIYKYSTSKAWLADGNPLMIAVVEAFKRGVTVRVSLNSIESGVDQYNATTFLASIGVPVRTISSPLYAHNKGVIVDGEYTLISSINWSKTSLQNNREAGAIIRNRAVAQYFTEVFDYDWLHGAAVSAPAISIPAYTVPTVTGSTIPAVTGRINVTCFTNPDNAYALAVVMANFIGSKRVFHAEMYSNTITSLTNQLVAAKQASPNMDMTVIFSESRAGSFDTTPTQMATLKNANVNIYESSTTFTYQHAKFWMSDNRRTTVFSGNWAGTSLTSKTSSSDPNREWGVVFDSPCVTKIYEAKFQADRGIATQFQGSLPCTNYDACGVCGGSGGTCPLASANFDACGVCGGDGSSCPAAASSSGGAASETSSSGSGAPEAGSSTGGDGDKSAALAAATARMGVALGLALVAVAVLFAQRR